MNEEDILSLRISEGAINRIRTEIGDLRHVMADYRCAMMKVETKFRIMNHQFGLENDYNPVDTIKTRVKSPESILEKLERRGLPLDIENGVKQLNDVAGVRIICPFVDDIYKISDCLLAHDDVFLVETKDYIKNPKENGYRSLHLIIETPVFAQEEKRLVKVEIQLRTIAMEFWANLEHSLRYKKELDPVILEELSAELKSCAETSAWLDTRMERVKRTLEAAKTFSDSNLS